MLIENELTVEKFDDGIVILGDSTDRQVLNYVLEHVGKVPLIVTDPPYGNILSQKWDRASDIYRFVSDMVSWTKLWSAALEDNCAFYVWGGIGKPKFRPFFRYICDVELETDLQLANLITWKKKRAYGIKHNYMFVREELAYFCKGDIKKPRTFNIPLLDEKRGYDGYNPKYKAKSEFYRRTNVWTDITELLRNKVHDAQKPLRVYEVPIEVHTNPGEWIIDMFAGSGTAALAARKLGRKFVLIENDKKSYDLIIKRLKEDE